MQYLLIPHEVSARTATLWIGVLDGAADGVRLELRSNLGPRPIGAPWQSWQAGDGGGRIDYQTISLSDLQPGTPYAFSLVRDDGALLADARLTTFPERIPSATGGPFIALVGTCFSEHEDQEGKVGQTYARLPNSARPHFKILSGDQVYLDSPWYNFLLHAYSRQELAALFFKNYTKTWGQAPGFNLLLKDGANYFASDDHEYWNNAPTRAPYVRDTWPLFDKREDWLQVARDLYRVFQTPAVTTTFAVEPVSFFIADTRFNRRDDRSDFVLSADLDRVTAWVEGLEGPGVLALGQPILQPKSGVLGRFTDWTLSDFEQYGALVRALARSRHSLVVVTGDVHYGRIARCELRPGVELIEIITSPLSLVDKSAAGNWVAAPKTFPPFEVPGMTKVPVTTAPFETNHGHFLTLEFQTDGAGVGLRVRFWPIHNPQAASPDDRFGETVWAGHLR